MTKVLIIGSTGMLGHTLFTELSKNKNLNVFGTARKMVDRFAASLSKEQLHRIHLNVDVNNFSSVENVFRKVKPDLVINCIGLIKQKSDSKDSLLALELNSVLPHKLAMLTEKNGGRYLQMSTDCVFDGIKGNYTEESEDFANDIYGTTKRLGEINYGNALTIRTSIIGHELDSHKSLVDWFFTQENETKGYTKAIFSGFPTVYIAHIISNYIIPNKSLAGLYHVSTDPINKYDLLSLIAKQYNKKIKIHPYDGVAIDRSLNSKRFRDATGFVPPKWEELISIMNKHFLASSWYRS